MKDHPGWARSVHQGNYRMTEGSKGVAGREGQMTKEQIVELVLLIKGFDVNYARFVLKREHARQPELGLMDAVRDALKSAA